MGSSVSGSPIADDDMPEWCEQYLSEGQIDRALNRTRWAVLLDHMPVTKRSTVTCDPRDDFTASTHHVALRLFVFVGTDDNGSAFPSIPTLAKATKLTETTVRLALDQLERSGWVSRRAQRWKSGRQAPNLYVLTWPEVDVIAKAGGGPARCFEPLTKKRRKSGAVCMRPAGWGTDSDDGPCVHHGGIPKVTPQPVRGYPSTTGGWDPSTSEDTPPTTGGECFISNASSLNASTFSGQRSSESSNGSHRVNAQEALTEEEQKKREEAEALFVQDLERQGLNRAEIATALVNGRRAAS